MQDQVPRTEWLRDTFRRVLMQAVANCQESDGSYFSRRLRSLTNASWIDITANIQAAQVDESESLIRGSWQYTIDRHAHTPPQVIQTEISSLASILVSVISHGAPVRVTFGFPPTETCASGQRLTCLFKGVVRGQLLCSARCPICNAPCLRGIGHVSTLENHRCENSHQW